MWIDDRSRSEKLLPVVYERLRDLARARLAKTPPGQTLQATALVHEAYLRLVRSGDVTWDGRRHFFAAAAQAMRDILVDQARRKASVRHGGDRRRASIEDVTSKNIPEALDALAVDEAVKRLEADDPRKGQIVNLICFAGFTTEETAATLNVSARTIRREWLYIRRWLSTQLASDPDLAENHGP